MAGEEELKESGSDVKMVSEEKKLASVKPMSRSPSRSESYSPSAPKSPTNRSSTSRSPIASRHGGSRSRSLSPRSRNRHSWSPDKENDRRDVCSVEITGLTRVIVKSHLEHIFSFYGSIDDIIIPGFQRSGNDRGEGWVIYRSSSSAQKAQDYMDGGQIDGVIVSVRQARMPEEERERASRDYGSYNRSTYPYSHRPRRDNETYSNRGRRGGSYSRPEYSSHGRSENEARRESPPQRRRKSSNSRSHSPVNAGSIARSP